jgi:hypothetical protein
LQEQLIQSDIEVGTNFKSPVIMNENLEQYVAEDVTPTWEGLLPMMLEMASNENPEGRKVAREELVRMAKAADAYNVMVKEQNNEK